MLSPWKLNDDIADSVNHNIRGKLCLWHSQNSSGDLPELLVDSSKAVVKDNHGPYLYEQWQLDCSYSSLFF